MSKTSVVIPSRNEPYLSNTVNDLLTKAKEDIEVIVVLDGYWPDPILQDDKRLILIHRSEAQGMRNAINSAASIATGEYLMKTDAHCMFDEGFDTVLKKDCDYNTLAVPSRYGLDVDNWKPKTDRPPTEYLFLTFPYVHEKQFGTGFHGKKWTGNTIGPQGWWEPERKLADKKIDEIMIWQGSCWFMHRKKFFEIDCLDTKYSYNMFQEANELSFKMWLSGGRLIINKNTWYAHWHKNTGTNNYRLSNRLKLQTEKMSTWFWMNNQWKKQTRDMKWYVEKFWPIPTWPDNWEEEKERYENDLPELWSEEIFKEIDHNGHNGLGI